MILKGKIKIFMIFFFCIAIHNSSLAQSPKYLIVSGKILSDSELNGVSTIQIVKNNQKAIYSSIPEHGRFRLELEYNTEYHLTFNQENHLSKTIVVNTEIPKDKLLQPKNFPQFLLAVKLYKDDQNPENFYSGDRVQQIVYSSNSDNFSRVPTMFDMEFVDKYNSNSNQTNHSQPSKSKNQGYQIF